MRDSDILLDYKYNDGGRKADGYKGEARDCVARAIAIATEQDYEKVRQDLIGETKRFREKSRSRAAKRLKSNTIMNSVRPEIYGPYLKSLGWQKVSNGFGSSEKMKMTVEDVPMGNVIVATRKHLAAVIDHVVQDAFDSRTSKKWVDGVPTEEDIPRTVNAYYIKAVSMGELRRLVANGG